MHSEHLYPDFNNGGFSILWDASKKDIGSLSRWLIKQEPFASLVPPQNSYSKKFHTNHEQAMYNFACCRIHQAEVDEEYGEGLKVWIAVPLKEMFKESSRYKELHMSYSHIITLLSAYHKLGLIEWIQGNRWCDHAKGYVTRVRPVAALADMIDEYLPDMPGNVSYILPREPVVLKHDGRRIEYKDCDKSRLIRNELQDFNGSICSRSLSVNIPITPSTITVLTSREEPQFVDSGDLDDVIELYFPNQYNLYQPSTTTSITVPTSPYMSYEEIVRHITHDVGRVAPWMRHIKPVITDSEIIYKLEEYHTYHKRVYSRGSWDYGGRFYAPYQNMPREFRQWWYIGGERVVEEDYKALHGHMLYHGLGLRPEDDPYTIDIDVPRKSVKTTFFVLLNAPNHQSLYGYMRRMEHHWDPRKRLDLNGYTRKQVVNAIKRKHKPIARYFHADMGIALQNKDSMLASRILKRLDSCVLHDGFLDVWSRENELVDIMHEEYHRMFGFDIPVERK